MVCMVCCSCHILQSGQDLASWGPLGLSHFRAPTHSINDLNPESQLKKYNRYLVDKNVKKALIKN